MEKKRIIIFTGGSLDVWALNEIQPTDIIVGADRGALFLIRHDIQPDLAIGDFDSVTLEEQEEIKLKSKQFVSCDPVMKDITDTEMAFEWALGQKADDIIIMGALGTRFDHSLANIHLLYRGLSSLVNCCIVDAYNKVILVNQEAFIYKGSYSHCSLLPLSMEVKGITIEGFQYPLINGELHLGQSLGISNVLLSESGYISITKGLLLVVLSKD